MDDAPTPGVYINAKGSPKPHILNTHDPEPPLTAHPGKKTFIPLENNPAVFTDLIQRLGISPQLGFYDIYSLSSPSLLSHIPRPVHALILISPAAVYHRVRAHDGPKTPLTYCGSGPDEPVFWSAQTIGHTCGLMALLHSVANGSAREFVRSGSLLARLLAAAEPLGPGPRARVLYDSRELERAHMAAALQGDTVPPSSEEPNGYHFLSFVKGKDGRLYELDGSRDGPIDRGLLQPGEDGLSEAALERGVGRHVAAAEGNLELSIVALATRPEEERDGDVV